MRWDKGGNRLDFQNDRIVHHDIRAETEGNRASLIMERNHGFTLEWDACLFELHAQTIPIDLLQQTWSNRSVNLNDQADRTFRESVQSNSENTLGFSVMYSEKVKERLTLPLVHSWRYLVSFVVKNAVFQLVCRRQWAR